MIGLWASPATAFADFSIETSVSQSRVAMGEELRLDIIVAGASGQISKPTITSLKGFTSYSQGHSQEISIVNGQMTNRSIFSYILIANELGKKQIGPFELVIGGRTFKVAAVDVEVVADNSSRPSGFSQIASQGPVSTPSPRALPSPGANVSSQDIFVKAWLDRDEVLINEPVLLTYTIYTRLSATYKGFEKEPVTTGFWVEDFPPEKNVRRTEQVLNGSRYVVADVRKMTLFPTQAGVYTLDPGVVSAMVEVREEDDFDSFFSYNIFGARGGRMPSSFLTQVVAKSIPTDPVTLTVKAFSEAGKPASFSGAVGRYEIESSVDKSQAEQGTPVTYRIRIAGQGNMNTVEVPTLPRLDGFKIYDSSSSVNIKKDRFVVEGEKVVETVLVPRTVGNFTIPALSFSYFDIGTRSYKELQTKAHTITVTPGAEPEEQAQSQELGVQPVAKKDVSFLSKDIRYIKTVDTGRPVFESWMKKPWFWAMDALCFVVASWLLWAASRKASVSNDLRGLRFRRSHRLAKRKLKDAESFLKKQDTEGFYREMSRALYGYFGDKLNLPSQNVNFESIEKSVAPSESSSEVLAEIRSLFDALSYGRFAQSSGSSDEMKKIYTMADRVITLFERVKLR